MGTFKNKVQRGKLKVPGDQAFGGWVDKSTSQEGVEDADEV